MKELRFMVPGHPPTANDRLHYLELNRRRQEFRHDAAMVAADARNRSDLRRFERVALTFHFVFLRRRKRDLDNLLGSVKPIVDGIVDAGLVVDDDLDHVVSITATARQAGPLENDSVLVSIRAIDSEHG